MNKRAEAIVARNSDPDMWRRQMEAEKNPWKYAHKTNNRGVIEDDPIKYEQEFSWGAVLGFGAVIALMVLVAMAAWVVSPG